MLGDCTVLPDLNPESKMIFFGHIKLSTLLSGSAKGLFQVMCIIDLLGTLVKVRPAKRIQYMQCLDSLTRPNKQDSTMSFSQSLSWQWFKHLLLLPLAHYAQLAVLQRPWWVTL